MKAGVLATSYSKIGGARHIFSNDTSLHVLLVGCNVSVERMPTVGNKLPAGTMIKCDSSKQNGGDIHYSFRMYEKSDSSTTVKVEKIMGNTVAKVGMVVGKAPTTAAGTTTGFTINAIDSSHDEYDILTLSGDAGNLGLADILVEVTQVGANAKFKVIPNAILPYDVDTIPGATLYPFNGAWMVTSEILEKRIPPVAPAIKKAMKDDESYPCVFRYTLYN